PTTSSTRVPPAPNGPDVRVSTTRHGVTGTNFDTAAAADTGELGDRTATASINGTSSAATTAAAARRARRRPDPLNTITLLETAGVRSDITVTRTSDI